MVNFRFFHDDETGTVYSDQIDDTTEKRIDEFTNEVSFSEQNSLLSYVHF